MLRYNFSGDLRLDMLMTYSVFYKNKILPSSIVIAR